ncbi:unnamed protein product, partial [Brassica rapa subsp. trilocularis]
VSDYRPNPIVLKCLLLRMQLGTTTMVWSVSLGFIVMVWRSNSMMSFYKDFEQLTLDFYHKGNLYGLEKYW